MDTLLGSTFEGRCRAVKPPVHMSFLTGSITALFILTNVPGNILVILAIVLDPNRNLRTPFNYLLANLATADLTVGLVGQPLSVYFHFKEGLNANGVDPNVEETTDIFYFITCTASVLSLSTLAVERYLAVRKPNTYRNKVTNKRIVATITFIWFISLTLPNINLFVGFSTFAFIFANTCVVVGVAIICATYFLMKRKLKSRKKSNVYSPNNIRSVPTDKSKIKNHPSAAERLSPLLNLTLDNRRFFEITFPATSTEANDTPRAFNTNIRLPDPIANAKELLEAKVTNMFLVVITALVCCYGPATLMIYIVHFCQDCSCSSLHCLEDISVLLSFLNSSVNFYCYALQSSRFRSAFAKLLKLNQRHNSGH